MFTGASDALNSAINIGTGGVNKVVGTHIPALGTSTSKTLDDTLNRMGAPQAENGFERVVGDVGEAVGSVPVMTEGAAMSGVKALEPIAEGIGQQMTSAAGAAGASGTARESGAPLWAQILAGVTGGGMGAIRTGENPEAAARIAEFKQAGIRPSAGDVTQKPFWQWVQKVINTVPFADNVVAAREGERVGQAASKAQDIAGGYGEVNSAQDMGQSVQDSIKNYRFGKRPEGMSDAEILAQPTKNSSIAAKSQVMYDRVPIQSDTMIDVPKAGEAIRSAAKAYDNPDLADSMADPKLKKWDSILSQSDGKLSWGDLKQLRTDIRYMQSKARLDPTTDDRALGAVYDGLTQDMFNGAQTIGGDTAANMVKQANSFYAQEMQGISTKLKNIYGSNKPEAVYSQIQSALSANPSRSDIGKLAELRRVMPDSQFGDLAATVIDGLGKPTPGANIAPGTPQFSVAQFVTRYNQMNPQARNILFNGSDNSELKESLDNFVKVLGNMKQADKFSNHSNTANLGARASWAAGAGASAVQAVHGNVAPAVAMGSALVGANIGARAIYNPTFVRLMTRTLASSPADRARAVSQIAQFAVKNPGLSEDARQVISSVAPVHAETDDAPSPKQ